MRSVLLNRNGGSGSTHQAGKPPPLPRHLAAAQRLRGTPPPLALTRSRVSALLGFFEPLFLRFHSNRGRGL